ncbi:MAG: adenylate/guanylate cyclase domain-containing protein [Candidatus Riflebacteria bacterium]|nr:adenylate/guanylate cyclase domain-containing protein [Candidatus Riflebacteria bacterium]
MEYKLLTVMFIDMQGYTRKSATQTIEEMKLFHDEMQAFVKQYVDKFGGIIVKSLGDGFLISFVSPTQAVMCGNEIQRKMEARNANVLNPDHFIRFRIGINTGEVGLDESGDLFGDPVNIASRIQTFAEPNEVFISESTFMAMNRNQFGVVDLGPQNLKNALREIKIYKVLKKGTGGVTVSAPQTDKKNVAQNAPSDGSTEKNSFEPYLKGILAGITVVLICIPIILKVIKKNQPQPENPISKPTVVQENKPPEKIAEKPPLNLLATITEQQSDDNEQEVIPENTNEKIKESFVSRLRKRFEKKKQNLPNSTNIKLGPVESISFYKPGMPPIYDINPLSNASHLALINDPKRKKMMTYLKKSRDEGKLDEAVGVLLPFYKMISARPPENSTELLQLQSLRLVLAQLQWEVGKRNKAGELLYQTLEEVPEDHPFRNSLENRIEYIRNLPSKKEDRKR